MSGHEVGDCSRQLEQQHERRGSLNTVSDISEYGEVW